VSADAQDVPQTLQLRFGTNLYDPGNPNLEARNRFDDIFDPPKVNVPAGTKSAINELRRQRRHSDR
jgi:hypothetical protein